MDSGGYWPARAAVWNPSGRLLTRYSPNYQTKIVLEKVNDDTPSYRYSAPVEPRYVSRRALPVEEPYRPFEYVTYYKPVTPAIPVIETTPIPVPTVSATVATTGNVETCVPKSFYSGRFRCLGYLIIILAILTFVFELADVIVTAYYKSHPCKEQVVNNAFTVPWFFTWVASGLWGSIPIFISGVLALTVKNNYSRTFQAFAIISSLSAFFFAPAIIGINAAEIATFMQYCGYTSVGDIGTGSDEGAKFALPIIIIVLSALLLLILLYLTYLLCVSYDTCVARETVVVANKQPTTTTPSTAVVPMQPALPVPVVLPAVDYVPVPATLPPPPPRDTTVPGRVVFMEAHNRGFAYANVPGYFTTLPPGNTTAAAVVNPASSGYYWK